MRQSFFLSLLILVSSTAVFAAEPAKPYSVPIPAETEILKTLKPEHPRLFAPKGEEERILKLIADHPKAKRFFDELIKEADKLVMDPNRTVEHKLVGPRLLDQSRACMNRVYTLATAYRLTKDKKYCDRAVTEMLAAAAFPDWNPSHYLDTAEMTHALGAGYDWLYHDMTPEQRKTIREAIRDKGLLTGKPIYEKNGWWAKSENNWNQVCNGGLTIGALAIAEDEPELAAWIVNRAANSVQIPMREFAPDGGYVEGLGYWVYGVSYNVFMLAALDTALGTDFGLSTFPAFDKTGDFRIEMIGPTGRAFCFADGSDRVGTAPIMFWLAKKFDKPHYAYHERELIDRSNYWSLWWFDPRGTVEDLAKNLPVAEQFRKVDVVVMRSNWTDPNALFLGLKGGSNNVNHSHLELGSFQFDANGERWFIDLGADNYNLPDFWGKKRFTYYRLSTAGHNTILIDGKNQEHRKGIAPITAFETDRNGNSSAAVDLSKAYPEQVSSASRTVKLDGKVIEFLDEFEGIKGNEIVWQAHTRATIKIDEAAGNKAVLTQNKKSLNAEIVEPKDAVWEIVSAEEPPEPNAKNKGIVKLSIRRPVTEKPGEFRVRFSYR